MPESTINNEQELLQRVAAGDARSFRELVDLFWKRVYGNTLTLTKRPEIAEELTQDIFLKIWNQRERLASVENFSVYIYVLGRNQVIDSLRKKVMDMASGVPGDMLEEALLPDLQLEMKETQRLILEGIEQLPLVRKKVFKMNRFEGLSYEEIAGQLGTSRNTVKDHMVMALNFLRNYMRNHAGNVLFLLLFLLIS